VTTPPETMPRADEPASPSGRRPSGSRRRVTWQRALAVTVLTAVVPGSGYWIAGRRVLGGVVMGLAVGLIVLAALLVPRDLHAGLELAMSPGRLRIAITGLAVVLVLWSVVLVTTYLLVRPRGGSRWAQLGGAALVTALCVVAATGVTVVARYGTAQAELVDKVFAEESTRSATAPTIVTRNEDGLEVDPWANRERLSVLLLGGDSGAGRTGLRTDTIILVSIDTETGRAVTFSLPRNLMNARFPTGSPLREIYPRGFRGPGDDGFWMLNAVYGQVPENHPGVLGDSANEGADAVKQAVEGTLGIPVDYYVLVDLKGFSRLVDAMGGVTVNVNTEVAIGGDTDRGIPPDTWLQPGRNRHLDGFHALWFARGRYGSDDYERMERQRCVVRAMIEQADPMTMATRYIEIAEAGGDMVRTDMPSDLVPAVAELALKIQDHPMRSVVFRSSDRFFPGNPDIGWMQERVQRALTPKAGGGGSGGGSGTSSKTKGSGSADPCAYDPEP
jgi:LCP family protein required for cell wall assembly